MNSGQRNGLVPAERPKRSSKAEGIEVESGLGQEAVEEAAPVLHPPEPGLHQRGQLIDVLLGEVSQRPACTW
jgi:hypothetical protein